MPLDTAPEPKTGPSTDEARAAALCAAGRALSSGLTMMMPVAKPRIRKAMETAFGGSDADGVWSWRDAWDACELALTLHLLRFAPVMNLDKKAPAEALDMLDELAALFPTQTVRSEQQIALQQFSTPAPYAFLAAKAAGLTEADTVLEPSCGLGSIALFGHLRGASLSLNELDPVRRAAAATVFRQACEGVDAGRIDDLLKDERRPTAIVMNPPFARSAARGEDDTAAADHVWSAFTRLAPGGRLVAIVNESCKPTTDRYRSFFDRVHERGALRLAAAVDGDVYKRHGTTVGTRLLVIDKPRDGDEFETSYDAMQDCGTLEVLADAIGSLPPRFDADANATITKLTPQPSRKKAAKAARTSVTYSARTGEPVAYTERADVAAAEATDDLFTPYEVRRIDIAGAKPHLDTLVSSAALAGVLPPMPSYVPELPPQLIETGALSAPQLETVIYAGEAHDRMLPGRYRWNDQTGSLSAVQGDAEGAAPADDSTARQHRQGFFLGDGTGVGKGRQVAAVILDNWIKGRRKHLWLSKSATLVEDAKRDWIALGGRSSDIHAIDRWAPGKSIPLSQGIVFCTYATLRSAGEKGSRLDQIVDWLGDGFDGVIGFDEAHEMGGAMTTEAERGVKAASQQGLAGVELQQRLPGARVLYVSATGATKIENLAYADRLGLWRGTGAPFPSREDFVTQMEAGGVAAMEVVCRDLVALGLYTARSLSLEGVEIDILDCQLTEDQIEDWTVFADAFQVIHNNLQAVMVDLGIEEVGNDGGVTCLNPRAKAQAISAFEGMKLRLLNHVLCAVKMPTVLRSIQSDVDRGEAVVVQLVSTGEAIAERKLAEADAEDLTDGTLDLSPREGITDYLQRSFPVVAHETYEDEEGETRTRPMKTEDGELVHSQEALRRRAHMLETLGSLPPIPSALDQLVWHFGEDMVAEVTGRSRRIIKEGGLGDIGLEVQNRGSRINFAETDAFMDDQKPILVFSQAGGTGRSYHADKNRANQRRRNHYIVEFGWRPETAVQGLGRTHRTNQASAPRLRPCVTDVKGEARFVSTICSRLAALGALTKGERRTGGQGMFRPEDDLTSKQAKEAMKVFFRMIAFEPVAGVSLERFEDITGLRVVDKDGVILDQLPSISRFLNRLLALPIELQNLLFEEFRRLINNAVETAIKLGTMDVGTEVIRGGRITITADDLLTTDEHTGAETRLVQIEQSRPLHHYSADDVLSRYADGTPVRNEKSGGVAVVVDWEAWTDGDGCTSDRVKIIRPDANATDLMSVKKYEETAWAPCRVGAFRALWDAEVAGLPIRSIDRYSIVSGLILPHWRLLNWNRPTIYRLTADDGRSYLGRVVDQDQAAKLAEFFGSEADVEVDPASMVRALERGDAIEIGPLTVRSKKFMHLERYVVLGWGRRDLVDLKADGCFTEIRGAKTWLHLPVSRDAAIKVVEKLITRFGSRPPSPDA